MDKQNISGLHLSRSSVYLLVILFILLFLFYIAPSEYSRFCNWIVFSLYISSLGVYFKKKKFTNYLDFEPIFVIIGTIMAFVFPLFVFNSETAYLFSFNKEYSLAFINKGTIISAIALVSFFLGNMIGPTEIKTHKVLWVDINNRLIIVCALLFYLLFLVAGGFEKYKSIYQNGGEVGSFTNYIEPILIGLIHVLAFNEIWNKAMNRDYKINIICIAFILMVTFQFLFVGARTIASFIILPIISFYTFKFYSVSFVKMILFITVSIFVMHFLQIYRSGYDTSLVLDWYYKLTDMLIPNTNTYLSLEIVDKQGISFGVTSFSSILLIIPFAQSYIQEMFGLSRSTLNSADVFTVYLDTSAGMGTNFIAELYLAFGVVGVYMFPFIFGYILHYLKGNIFTSYYKSIILFVICGFSVYLVRSGLFYMIRFIVYALFFASLNLSILKRNFYRYVR